ncbi:MAG: dual specificity protein phosphatase family protein [Cyanobacteria bacterium J06621_8]
MLPTLYHLKEINSGRLSIMAKPIGEWLSDEIQNLKNMGIDVIISLLTKEEIEELHLEQEEFLSIKNGIKFLSYPIMDRGVPISRENTSIFIKEVCSLISLGNNVVIHCRAGIGRSGLMAALTLLHQGLTTEEAFKLISNSRRVEVPDTKEQYKFVKDYENEFKNHSFSL